MRSTTARALVGAAIVVVAIVILVVLNNGNSDSGQTTKGVPTIVVENGHPVGGVRQLVYNEGERVRFEVESDVSDEIHIHGYDLMRDVKAGGSVSFDFPAAIEGVFEGELERRGEQILELRVNP